MPTTGDGNLVVTELDFGNLRDNFIQYLRGQSYFKDYDFSGSGLAVILDILAYNTHYQAFYANMVANEMFLDSAVKRSSIVSRAKELGYTPRSYRASKSTINVVLSADYPFNTATPVLPRYTQFSAIGQDSRTYRFTNLSAEPLIVNSDGSYSADIVVAEGSVRTLSFVVDSTNPNQRFVIPDVNADTSTMVLRVQTSVSDNTGVLQPWLPNNDFNTIDSTSEVYFLQESYDGLFEITFGDGIVGKKPGESNLITLEYLVTNGPYANNIGNAEFLGNSVSPTFVSSNTYIGNLKVVSPATGGAVSESERSIQFYSPLSYQSQDRAVTALDYSVIVAKEFADTETISVWGGEDNDPPFYGRVFVSIKPNSSRTISRAEKESIVNDILASKNLVTVRPIVVDPDFTFLRFNSVVVYEPSLTGLSSNEIQTNVIANIRNYVNNTLEKFNIALKFSKILTTIDATNASIDSNYTTIDLEKRFIPLASSTKELRFQNPILHPYDGFGPVLSSNSISYKLIDGTVVDAFLEDLDGIIRLFYNDSSGTKIIFNDDVGTISYATGLVSLTNFNPVMFPSQEIRVVVTPETPDIFAFQNNILTVDQTDRFGIQVVVKVSNTNDVTRTTNTDFYASRSNRLSSE